MTRTQILLWKTIEGNRRLRVRVRVRFLLFYSELAPLTSDVICSRLYLDGEKYEEAMSQEHPHNTQFAPLWKATMKIVYLNWIKELNQGFEPKQEAKIDITYIT